eukprot:g11529.t1
MPAEQLKQQAEKTKALEDKVKSHKRELALIYDAAMKQAKKKEEEGVNEVKHKFERELGNMRREVDLELSKTSKPGAISKPSARTKRVSRSPAATGEDDPKSTPVRKQESRADGDLTSQLMVSPTKVIGVVTPINPDGRGSDKNTKYGTQTFPDDRESPTPKKKAKRLFPTLCP